MDDRCGRDIAVEFLVLEQAVDERGSVCRVLSSTGVFQL